jgi:short-subunit dehydrogenase
MNIVLTGASRGIGFETALALASSGISNLVIISRNEEKLKKLKALCQERNKKLTVIIVCEDLVKLSYQHEKIYQKIQLDEIDVLINNAGHLVNKPFELLDDSDISDMVEVNFRAPARLIKQLLKLLQKDTASHVVNISSMGGFQGSSKFPGLSIYSSTKAAIASLTECLAVEYSQSNIRFNCLALGAVQTEMLNEAFPGYKAPVQPDKMGEFIADFALNGQNLFNGKIIPVNFSNP